MAFASAKLKRLRGALGRFDLVMGTYTSSAGGTGGDIDTGLRKCFGMRLQPTGNAVKTNNASVNETFTAAGIDGSAVTIVSDADEVGIWIAFGFGKS